MSIMCRWGTCQRLFNDAQERAQHVIHEHVATQEPRKKRRIAAAVVAQPEVQETQAPDTPESQTNDAPESFSFMPRAPEEVTTTTESNSGSVRPPEVPEVMEVDTSATQDSGQGRLVADSQSGTDSQGQQSLLDCPPVTQSVPPELPTQPPATIEPIEPYTSQQPSSQEVMQELVNAIDTPDERRLEETLAQELGLSPPPSNPDFIIEPREATQGPTIYLDAATQEEEGTPQFFAGELDETRPRQAFATASPDQEGARSPWYGIQEDEEIDELA